MVFAVIRVLGPRRNTPARPQRLPQADAYEPLKEAFSQVTSDKIVLSFEEKCLINSTGLGVLMDLLPPLE